MAHGGGNQRAGYQTRTPSSSSRTSASPPPIITSSTAVGTALNANDESSSHTVNNSGVSLNVTKVSDSSSVNSASSISSASALSELQQQCEILPQHTMAHRSTISSPTDTWSPQLIDIQGRRKFTINEIHDRHVQIEIPPNGELMDVKPSSNMGPEDGTIVCLTCYENLMKQLEEESQLSQMESDKYEEVRQNLLVSQQREQMRDENGRTKQENEKIRELQEQLAGMEQKCDEARKELQLVKKESLDLKRKEESYWNVFFQTKERRHSTIQERTSMRRRLQMFKEFGKYAATFSEKKMFRLWYDGSIVTINELRLGSLTHQITSWEEINAAWGLCALLLHMMAQWQGISFSMYSIKPQGSTSHIEHIDTGKLFPLHFKNMRSISEFNTAMEAFLYCLKEFLEHPLFRDNRVTEYHRFTTIDQHRIDGKSIRLATSKSWGSKYDVKESDEWCSAVNNVILTLKWLRREVKK